MSNLGSLYILNAETGEATKISEVSIADGLASHNGQVYIFRGNTLHTLDIETGRSDRVGNNDGIGIDFLLPPRGLVSHNGQLYLTGGISNAIISFGIFYVVSTETGVATQSNGFIQRRMRIAQGQIVPGIQTETLLLNPAQFIKDNPFVLAVGTRAALRMVLKSKNI